MEEGVECRTGLRHGDSRPGEHAYAAPGAVPPRVSGEQVFAALGTVQQPWHPSEHAYAALGTVQQPRISGEHVYAAPGTVQQPWPPSEHAYAALGTVQQPWHPSEHAYATEPVYQLWVSGAVEPCHECVERQGWHPSEHAYVTEGLIAAQQPWHPTEHAYATHAYATHGLSTTQQPWISTLPMAGEPCPYLCDDAKRQVVSSGPCESLEERMAAKRRQDNINQKNYQQRKKQELAREADAQKAVVQGQTEIIQKLEAKVEDQARCISAQEGECDGLRNQLTQITEQVEKLKLQLNKQAGPILEELEKLHQQRAQVERRYVRRLRSKDQGINVPTTRALPANTRYEPPIIHIKEGMAVINKASVEARGVLVDGAIPGELLTRMKRRQECETELARQLRAGGVIRASHDGDHDKARRLIRHDELAREDKEIANDLAKVLMRHGMPCLGLTRLGSMAGGANQGIHIDMPHENGGFAAILAVTHGTYILVHLRYDDHKGARDEYVAIPPGMIFWFPGNQPHAGVGYKVVNARWHWYDRDPGTHMEQLFVYPTDEIVTVTTAVTTA